MTTNEVIIVTFRNSLVTMTTLLNSGVINLPRQRSYTTGLETKQILLLHQALTDRAFAFYQSLPEDVKSSMPSIFEALNNRFGLQSKNIMMRLQELNRKQQPHESVAAYSKDMLSIMERLQMKDDAANINQYLQGLKPEIRDQMLLMKPTSLRDAELNALLLEKSLETSPETQLLASLKSLTSDIQKEHAKVVASATAAANSVSYADPPPTSSSDGSCFRLLPVIT